MNSMTLTKLQEESFPKWTGKILPQTIHQLGLPIPRHTEPRKVKSNFFGNYGLRGRELDSFRSSHSSSFLFHPFNVLEDSLDRLKGDRISMFFFEKL